ncbi:MAG: beta-galactosidase [Candidatus Hydrogenedentes bacterium]|nr:beta-galactosidase [Candidatus Hydrogenedentota bacterium]
MLRLVAIAVVGVMGAFAQEKPIETFDGSALPPTLKQNNVDASVVRVKGERVLEVRFKKSDWPNVYFAPREGAWDFSEASGIAIDVYNPEDLPVTVSMRVDNAGADGENHCVTAQTSAGPGKWTTLRALFNPSDSGPYWGMRGIPGVGPLGKGKSIDPACIVAIQIFLPRPAEEHTLYIDNIRLAGKSTLDGASIPFPFVDRFGQYKRADWPGKIKDERGLAKSAEREARDWKRHESMPQRDRFGGWADGPQLKATGWFRTENVDGKWWLITPEGHLFFSVGMDCVGTWEQTFVEQRDNWFEWLPAENDPVFGAAYGKVSGAHSMAERIGGQGRTFSFYRANLIRKYGKDFSAPWRDSAYTRLKSWGFNTVANWAQHDVVENSPMPFTATAGIYGDIRRIEGGGGYWAKMADAYDPSFADAVEKSVAPAAKKWADNPLCIGYFVDNEISWEAIEVGTLASPPDQPCRIAHVEMLKQKYGDLASLNKAWDTSAADWNSLRVPGKRTFACQADLDDFVYAFGRRYFETINTVLKNYAPNHLYLGCRFSSAPKPAVRACADVVDVVSFNFYRSSIGKDEYVGGNSLGKPILIGEFHFGALDRGMFHTGLVATRNQKDRAAAYARYVNSVIDNPSFVGCHWFQYVDEPITGRWYDGENYNIGFLTVTDTPYPEMVRAARKVHNEMYQRRFGN